MVTQKKIKNNARILAQKQSGNAVKAQAVPLRCGIFREIRLRRILIHERPGLRREAASAGGGLKDGGAQVD
ncbi:MAG: hypothetical protein LBC53_01015 [Spirochaetaceae bacterium]|jgi:hypothetical protein|nr:hypothetical protein [Spirochaetaceae bacterium]